jgi:pyruvate/2-oxoglutarate dehydrogenase complex dihydrolipoamide acyltransferase (E2) component
MLVNVIMPKEGLQMIEGTIVRWLFKEGDRIDEGEALFEIETDKVSMSIESTVTGTLLKILRQEGNEVPVGETVAVMDEEIAADWNLDS